MTTLNNAPPKQFQFIDRDDWVLFGDSEALVLKMVPVVGAKQTASVDSFEVVEKSGSLKTQLRGTKPRFAFRVDHNGSILDIDVLSANPVESASRVSDVVSVTKRFVYVVRYPIIMLSEMLSSIPGQLNQMQIATKNAVQVNDNSVAGIEMAFASSIRYALIPALRKVLGDLYVAGVTMHNWSDSVMLTWKDQSEKVLLDLETEFQKIHKEYNRTEGAKGFVSSIRTLLVGFASRPTYQNAIAAFKGLAKRTMFSLHPNDVRDTKIDAIFKVFTSSFRPVDAADAERKACSPTSADATCVAKSAPTFKALRDQATNKAYF